MSSFFQPHQPFGEVTLDDIRPYFQPPRYPTDDETNSDTLLTPTISVDSDPLEPSYPNHHVETNPFKPSYSSVIRLTPDLSSSSATPRHTPPLVHGRGFIRTCAVPRGRGRVQGGGCGPSGFRNSFLPLDE